MKKETALEFLFYSYFNIDFETAKNEHDLLIVAIERAYRDAASHVLQVDSGKADKDKINDDRQEHKNKAINKLFECITQDRISDDWHKNAVDALIETYAGSDLIFTFGIAQKWVNMTVKYLFIMNSVLKETGNVVLDNICEKFDGMIDVPVDDYIIRAACDGGICVPCRDKNKEYSGMKDKYSSKIPWSQWEDTYYTEFQETIKKEAGDEHILDYENRLWIKTAMKQNGK